LLDALELRERLLAGNVHRGVNGQAVEDLDQLMSVLVRTRPRRERRVQLLVGMLGRDRHGHVPGRAEHQVHRDRRDALMADERGVQLEREISLWKDCVEAQDVRARPRVRRLALGGLAVEGDRELDRGTVGHGLTVAQLDDSRP